MKLWGPRLIRQLQQLLELLVHPIHTVERHDAQADVLAHGLTNPREGRDDRSKDQKTNATSGDSGENGPMPCPSEPCFVVQLWNLPPQKRRSERPQAHDLRRPRHDVPSITRHSGCSQNSSLRGNSPPTPANKKPPLPTKYAPWTVPVAAQGKDHRHLVNTRVNTADRSCVCVCVIFGNRPQLI